jgi:hypothetical protein
MESCDNKGLWDLETEGSGAVMECCDLEMRVGDEEGSWIWRQKAQLPRWKVMIWRCEATMIHKVVI